VFFEEYFITLSCLFDFWL